MTWQSTRPEGQITEAIREDKLAIIDFHIGFGFPGSPWRGKFSVI